MLEYIFTVPTVTLGLSGPQPVGLTRRDDRPRPSVKPSGPEEDEIFVSESSTHTRFTVTEQVRDLRLR
jgi:hypothetical protein